MKEKWYGNFDLKYAGASINCNTDYKIKALEKYITRCRSHYYVNPDDVELENREDVYLYNTAYFHEARHVHEHLQCPILNYMYRERLMALFHALQFTFNWQDFNIKRYNVLPIPLGRWFRKNDEEKKKYIHLWETDWSCSGLQAPQFYAERDISLRDTPYILSVLSSNPKYREDKLLDLILLATAYYDEYERIRQPKYDQGGCEYSIRTLIEASAFVHQTAAIYSMFGRDEGEEYVQNVFSEVFDSKRFTDYTTIITFIFRYLNHAKFNLKDLFPFVSYLVNWCLSGNVLSEDTIANPIDRLKLFTKNNLAASITMQDIYMDPLGVFAYWDKKIGSIGLNYEKYATYNFNEFEKLKEAMRTIGYDHITQLYDYVDMIAQASDSMIHKFIEDPNQFLLPELYLKHIYDYVNVPVRFMLDTPLSISRNKLDSPLFDWSLYEDDRNEMDINKLLHYISSDQPRFPLSPNQALLYPKTKALLSYKKSEEVKLFFKLTDSLFDTDYAKSPDRIIKNYIDEDLFVGFVWN